MKSMTPHGITGLERVKTTGHSPISVDALELARLGTQADGHRLDTSSKQILKF
jgi:hypothetical protein